FDFPGWHQNRTVVQGLVSVPSAELEATDLRGYASYNLAMNGEVLLGDDTLEYLHRSGVTVYSIGLALDGSSARRVLRRFAEETGGRSFFLDSVAELAAAYAVIREELRTKYLLAYQSANTSGSDEFRRVEVKLVRRGLKARTMRGYYP
ncbi:MAG: hypothetical protein GY856_06175, partial [bacterium]|nr:hypothetical protein [bacterium]